MESAEQSFIPIKRIKSNEKRRSKRKSVSLGESRAAASLVPELVIPPIDAPHSMSVESSNSTTSPTSSNNNLSPEHIESSGSCSRLLRRSSSGSNQTGSREKLTYTNHADGLLHRNTVPFVDIDFCFRCNAKPPVPSDLRKSVEKISYKLTEGGLIPVYRTVYLCAECICWLKNERTLRISIGSSSGDEETVPRVKMTEEALHYFNEPK